MPWPSCSTAWTFEHHWLPGQNVSWRTGNALNEEQGPASNGGAFVAAVAARLKVPMPAPVPDNFLPGSQADWLLNQGKAKGWVPVGAVEAQLLANRGWLVIAAWEATAPADERGAFGANRRRPAGWKTGRGSPHSAARASPWPAPRTTIVSPSRTASRPRRGMMWFTWRIGPGSSFDGSFVSPSVQQGS